MFTLLETLYNSFDKIASRRGVYKVETVGNWYVESMPSGRKVLKSISPVSFSIHFSVTLPSQDYLIHKVIMQSEWFAMQPISEKR